MLSLPLCMLLALTPRTSLFVLLRQAVDKFLQAKGKLDGNAAPALNDVMEALHSLTTVRANLAAGLSSGEHALPLLLHALPLLLHALPLLLHALPLLLHALPLLLHALPLLLHALPLLLHALPLLLHALPWQNTTWHGVSAGYEMLRVCALRVE